MWPYGSVALFCISKGKPKQKNLMAMGQNPKSQVPPVNIPIQPLKYSKMGGEFTYQPGSQNGFDGLLLGFSISKGRPKNNLHVFFWGGSPNKTADPYLRQGLRKGSALCLTERPQELCGSQIRNCHFDPRGCGQKRGVPLPNLPYSDANTVSRSCA